MSDIVDKFKDAFITCNSEPGKYCIKAQFKTLEEAQAAHRALVCELADRCIQDIK